MGNTTLSVLDGEAATAEIQAEEAKWRPRRGVSEASVLAAPSVGLLMLRRVVATSGRPVNRASSD